MENKNALIGRLKIMKAYAQNETQRICLEDAISYLKCDANEKQNQNHLQELTAALDMLSYKLCRREAEVLRDTVEYLETMKEDTNNG